ncbi:DUF3231 family protein [Salibacterium qingdaonense]|uniref:DUF3231 family protein n=1 Tax=Salibacterium qingdaonense TaxID=266892 RepID=A0A1I4KJW1_9BACI|nr:DUF3231 family protein [Salibacterium qingdaonense]SFL78931.1 Protein of unknown function [Salibacterium qingdaonense]
MFKTLEAIASLIHDYTDKEPKPPLHVGEVMDLWTAYTSFQEAQVLYQVGLNSTTDPDLEHALQKALKSSKADTKKLETFLLKEGVPLPPVSSPKPNSETKAVPKGVQLTNEEIASMVSVKIATSTSFCAEAISTSLRSDVAVLFFEMQVHLMQFAQPFKSVMKNRGWMHTPPAYTPPGSPDTP